MLSRAILEEVERVGLEVSVDQGERVLGCLMNFLRFAKEMPVEKVGQRLVDEYARKRVGEVAKETVRKELFNLVRMLRRNGVVVVAPRINVGKKTELRNFTPEELKAFFAACETWPGRKLLFALMLATGARPAELIPSRRSKHVALLKSEVDLENGMVTIRSAKAMPGKEGPVRVVALPWPLVEPLRSWMNAMPGKFVFRSNTNLASEFNRFLKRAGIEKINALGRKLTSHSFRHTYATIGAEQLNGNQFLLQSALGHSNINTTARYAHARSDGMDLLGNRVDFEAIFGSMGVTSGCNVIAIEAKKVV